MADSHASSVIRPRRLQRRRDRPWSPPGRRYRQSGPL